MAAEAANLGVIVPAAPICWPDGRRILARRRAGYGSLYELITMPGGAS
jgi:hypothetical protein